MLKSTFQHLKGIGAKSEKIFWSKGITTWDAYRSSHSRQIPLFDDPHINDILTESIQAYEAGDMDFFARFLPVSDYYRVLLDFPQEVIFVDIETTGLSVYYDIITIIGWSVGNKYDVYINGGDEKPFTDALSQAKAIVTFNGIMFDLKFIGKHFKDIKIPPIHLDLRFFAKRAGFSGGQKNIEKHFGFRRGTEIKDMLGEAAPILWHKYRRGDQAAMKRLIEYNHADIEGMKFILDETIRAYIKKEGIPKEVKVTPRFKKQKSPLRFIGEKSRKNASGVKVIPYTGSNEPLLTYRKLNEIYSIDDFCVVGIDLVSSEEKESGFCTLKGNLADTCRIKTDDDMIDLAIKSGANIISIDSPLSIPRGRVSFFDDDPGREEFGITRECERVLKRRGISSYPCLIPSMQKLTQRGILLAEKFRKKGIPVIESYPGAAQDIMSIPRKQAGLDYLIDGLKEFGLIGEFMEKPVSHDELDAITSAIVGHFFWVGMYEKLGNPEEKYLIIPDLNGNYKFWLSRKIIGVSGQVTLDKITTAEYLNKYHFFYHCYSQGCGGWISESINGSKHGVISGLQSLEDRALLIETYGPAFRHIYFTSSPRREDEIDPLAQLAEHTIDANIFENPIEHPDIQEFLREKCP